MHGASGKSTLINVIRN